MNFLKLFIIIIIFSFTSKPQILGYKSGEMPYETTKQTAEEAIKDIPVNILTQAFKNEFNKIIFCISKDIYSEPQKLDNNLRWKNLKFK